MQNLQAAFSALTTAAQSVTRRIQQDDPDYPPAFPFSDACAACDSPCTEHHPQISERLQSKIKTKGSMVGTVKPYQTHLVLCTGNATHSWASRIETESNLVRAIEAAAPEWEKVVGGRILITACDRPCQAVQSEFDAEGNEVEKLDIMILPEFQLMTHVTVSNVDALFSAYFRAKALPPGEPRAQLIPLDHKQVVLVCSHKKVTRCCHSLFHFGAFIGPRGNLMHVTNEIG
jgi:hypothetical protein